MRFLALAVLPLAIAPIAAASTSPAQLAKQRFAASVAAEAYSSFTTWLHKETKNGMPTPCDAYQGRHATLHAIAAADRIAADDAWLLARLVQRDKLTGAAVYLKRADVLSRQAAKDTVRLRRCS